MGQSLSSGLGDLNFCEPVWFPGKGRARSTLAPRRKPGAGEAETLSRPDWLRVGETREEYALFRVGKAALWQKIRKQAGALPPLP